MSNPAISVIVPVYNAETTICRCVDSVLSQTVPISSAYLVMTAARTVPVRFVMNMLRGIAASEAFRCGRGSTF